MENIRQAFPISSGTGESIPQEPSDARNEAFHAMGR